MVIVMRNRIVCNTLCCVDATRCVYATWLRCGVDATVSVAWMQHDQASAIRSDYGRLCSHFDY